MDFEGEFFGIECESDFFGIDFKNLYGLNYHGEWKKLQEKNDWIKYIEARKGYSRNYYKRKKEEDLHIERVNQSQ